MLAGALSGKVTSDNYRLFFIYFLSTFLAYFNFSCLGHVINLGNVDVMGHITKIAAVENATAIWEYDPTREDNRVLGGSLDVIAAIRTLAIKVNVVLSLYSGSHIISTFRFKLPANALNTSTAPRFVAGYS
jgi:hypothetical protein